MTKTEYNWISNAVRMLDEGHLSKMQEAKVLRTIAQLFTKAADKAEMKFCEQVDDIMSQNHTVMVLKNEGA